MNTQVITQTQLTLGLPAKDGVGVWLVPASDAWVGRLAGFLSPDEREDVARLARSEERPNTAIARGLWRALAGEALGRPAERVGVERTAFGRQMPEGLARTECDIGVSSSRTLVGAVCGRGVRVGIDLEHRFAVRADEASIGQSIEGIVGGALEQVPDTAERTILRLCFLEALLQADGRGIHLSSSMVSADIRKLWDWNMARVAGTVWWVRRIPVPDGYFGAIATGAPCEDLRVVDLPEPGLG